LLAGLTLLRSAVVNLHLTDTWHGISVRLLSLTIVATAFYALSRLSRLPDLWREQGIHHIYSWAASALVSLLMWYELQPLTVAVGWAVFGLVLFEYGLMRNVKQFRWQSYVALTAAFGRIFFANLAAGSPGELWGPGIYTVLPITLILFFVYSQIGEKNSEEDSRLRFDTLIAYLGTATVVAILYFQFQNDWLVTAWASVVLGLFIALVRQGNISAPGAPVDSRIGGSRRDAQLVRSQLLQSRNLDRQVCRAWFGNCCATFVPAFRVSVARSMAGGDHEKMVRGHSCSSGTGHVFCSNPASDAHARPEDEGWDGDGLVGTGRNADHPAGNGRQ
jgi:hypothetical protein